MSLVSFVKFDSQTGPLGEAIKRSLNLIKFEFNPTIRKVAIKPNMCYYWDYSTGETTDPRFIGTLVDVIREFASENVDISVVESDASAMKCHFAFKMLGYENLAKKKGIRLVNLTNDKAQVITVKVRNKTYKFSIPQTITDADLFINVPKIKYMSACKMSCALKNVFGCNPSPKKYRLHSTLDEAIVGLNKIMPSDLCIIDGVIVRGMTTLKLGLIMASTDPVAMDAAAARIAGIDPISVKYIKLASMEKVGSIHFKPVGLDLNYFKRLFPRKTVKSEARKLLSIVYGHLVARKS